MENIVYPNASDIFSEESSVSADFSAFQVDDFIVMKSFIDYPEIYKKFHALVPKKAFNNDALNQLFKLLVGFCNKNSFVHPTYLNMSASIDRLEIAPDVKKELQTVLTKIKFFDLEKSVKSVEDVEKIHVMSWLENAVAKESLINALATSSKLDGGQILKQTANYLSKKSDELEKVKRNKDVFRERGIRFGDVDFRSKMYNVKSRKFPFLIHELNKITDGGIEPKSLNLLLAGTGKGKSAVMVSLAADFLKQGLNVLYVTLELSEEKILKRFDANIADVSQKELAHYSNENFQALVDYADMIGMGQLVIKEYPSAYTSSNTVRRLINDYKNLEGIKFEVVIVDYLGILGADTQGVNSEMYIKGKFVAQELRDIAIEEDLAIITAQQVSRNSQNDEKGGLEAIAESMGIAHTADIIIYLAHYQDKKEKMLWNVSKNRYSEYDNYSFITQSDFAHCKFSNNNSADALATLQSINTNMIVNDVAEGSVETNKVIDLYTKTLDKALKLIGGNNIIQIRVDLERVKQGGSINTGNIEYDELINSFGFNYVRKTEITLEQEEQNKVQSFSEQINGSMFLVGENKITHSVKQMFENATTFENVEKKLFEGLTTFIPTVEQIFNSFKQLDIIRLHGFLTNTEEVFVDYDEPDTDKVAEKVILERGKSETIMMRLYIMFKLYNRHMISLNLPTKKSLLDFISEEFYVNALLSMYDTLRVKAPRELEIERWIDFNSTTLTMRKRIGEIQKEKNKEISVASDVVELKTEPVAEDTTIQRIESEPIKYETYPVESNDVQETVDESVGITEVTDDTEKFDIILNNKFCDVICGEKSVYLTEKEIHEFESATLNLSLFNRYSKHKEGIEAIYKEKRVEIAELMQRPDNVDILKKRKSEFLRELKSNFDAIKKFVREENNVYTKLFLARFILTPKLYVNNEKMFAIEITSAFERNENFGSVLANFTENMFIYYPLLTMLGENFSSFTDYISLQELFESDINCAFFGNQVSMMEFIERYIREESVYDLPQYVEKFIDMAIQLLKEREESQVRKFEEFIKTGHTDICSGLLLKLTEYYQVLIKANPLTRPVFVNSESLYEQLPFDAISVRNTILARLDSFKSSFSRMYTLNSMFDDMKKREAKKCSFMTEKELQENDKKRREKYLAVLKVMMSDVNYSNTNWNLFCEGISLDCIEVKSYTTSNKTTEIPQESVVTKQEDPIIEAEIEPEPEMEIDMEKEIADESVETTEPEELVDLNVTIEGTVEYVEIPVSVRKENFIKDNFIDFSTERPEFIPHITELMEEKYHIGNLPSAPSGMVDMNNVNWVAHFDALAEYQKREFEANALERKEMTSEELTDEFVLLKSTTDRKVNRKELISKWVEKHEKKNK